MYDLCPLCLKKGVNTKIKAIWVNFEEAVWMCQKPECPHPFLGSEDITFFTRKVGEKWGWELQEYRTVEERVGSIPISTELSLYTPPVTPSCDASTKDSGQTEITRNTPGSTQVISVNTLPRDSYAPRSNAEIGLSRPEKVDKAKKLKSTENAPYEKDSKIVDTVLPSIQSIFDIDGDSTDKISIKLCPDLASSEQLSPAVLDTKNSAIATNSTDTVLVTNSRLQKSRKIKQKLVESTEHSTVKGIPLVRSIARTNIDLHRFDPPKVVKIENPVTPPKRKIPKEIPERLFSPTQHTTTITVDGMPPITLSYNLADLEEKIIDNVPTTSTPNFCKKQLAVLPINDKELWSEIPKKKLRQSAVRRGRDGNKGKAFEKFSFSTLKKIAKDSNTTETPVAVKIESLKLEEITNRTESCNYVNDSPIKVEALNSINLDATNSSVTEGTAVDLNCLLDDMLLDSYQNATQNLNDDWLESFFDDNT